MADLARARATRSSSEAADRQQLAELEARTLELPPGLEVEWLGVSGYRLSYEGQTLFIDPYLSRVPFRSLISRHPALPSEAALDRFLHTPGETVGVLVGHTHFDHAVDAPAIARRTGCRAYGSDSLVNLMALHGLADRAVEVEPYRTYELGPFAVSFTPSVHSTSTPRSRTASSTNVQLSELPEEIAAVSRDFEVAALPRSDRQG